MSGDVKKKRFLTVDDVAEELEVPRKSVYQWVRAKKLAAYKIGRHVKVTHEALDDFLKRSEMGVEDKAEPQKQRVNYARQRQVRRELEEIFKSSRNRK